MTTQWVTDLEELFAATLATVATIRTANSLPTATVHIGAQYLEFSEAAPRIVIVPTGTRYEAKRNGQGTDDTDYVSGQIPLRKFVYFRWMLFTAHFWGEPDPQFLQSPTSKLGSQYYPYNTTIELEREFFYALQANLSIPMAFPTQGEWILDTKNSQYGQNLAVQFQIGTPVTAEPYTILPYAVSSGDTDAVVRDITITIGSSSVGPIVTPGDES